jgi:dCMP deaminase
MFPCNECAKLLIQAGVGEVVFHEGKLPGGGGEGAEASGGRPAAAAAEGANVGGGADPCYRASRLLMQMAGVRLRQHRLDFVVTIDPN